MRPSPPALLLLLALMLRRTASLAAPRSERTRVAVVGAGVAGCSFAAALLDSAQTHGRSFDITMFEGGRGVGGRMSTRQVELEDGTKMSFDHGCPAIDPPKAEAFRREVERWKERGWIKPWKGTFAKIRPDNGRLTYRDVREERWVGVPKMSSLCQNLLQTQSEHSTIRVATGAQARAIYLPSYPEATSVDAVTSESENLLTWRLEKQHSNEGMVQLGDFDWLVSTDRNSLKEGRPDIEEAGLNEFRKSVNENVGSVPMITALVAFNGRVPLKANAIDLDGADERFGALGKLIRDSSKLGRQDEGNGASDQWVLHGSREAGQRLLDLPELKGASLQKIRPRIGDRLTEDFLRAIPLLAELENGDKSCDGQVKILEIVYSAGHRWGAAFPTLKNEEDASVGNRQECHFDAQKRFLACGDYFGTQSGTGTVEAAFLSGRAAAHCLIESGRSA